MMGKRKAQSGEMGPLQKMKPPSQELTGYERKLNEDKYKGCSRGVNSFTTYNNTITSKKGVQQLGGVTKLVSAEIDVFVHTGRVKKMEFEKSKVIDSLTTVYGIELKNAQELFALGVKSIADLQNYKEKLNHHQLIGLKYLEDFKKKIPRSEIAVVEKKIKKALSSVDMDYKITICGSYRRGKPESDDINILVTHPNFTTRNISKDLVFCLLKSVIKKLENISLITERVSMGVVKFMGVCKVDAIPRKLEIRLIPLDEYYCALLHFTGSDEFNKKMRNHALQEGFTLNEYCIKPVAKAGAPGKQLTITSERDVFNHIKFPYKEPSERC